MKKIIILILSLTILSCHKKVDRLHICIENESRISQSVLIKLTVNDSVITNREFQYSNVTPHCTFFNLTVRPNVYKYQISIKDTIVADTIQITTQHTSLMIGYNEFKKVNGLKKVIGVDKIHGEVILQ